MNKEFVMHRMEQLKMVATVLEDVAEGKVTLDTQRLAVELLYDDPLLKSIGTAIGLPDLQTCVHMLAGYNEDNLYRAHILLQRELWEEPKWPPNA